MGRDALGELAGVSKLAYGNIHTLLVMMGIADHPDDLIFPMELTKYLHSLIDSHGSAVKLSASTVSETLTKLAQLGLLQKLPEDGNKKPYQRIPTSAGWLWASELAGDKWRAHTASG